MALSPGSRLGGYEVSGIIGAGGMGEVYRATDLKLGRTVALKVLPAALANDSDYLARFHREAQVLAALNHPNIAAIYGLEENAIVMELVDGQTLAEVGKPSLEETLQYTSQIAEALEAAHERGVVHRDLKPANVKVTPEGTIKVLDFGLAKADSVSPQARSHDSPTLSIRATQAGVILGTAAYMSPEQAAGKPVDRRADIWSFGVLLFELLTGQRLFAGESIAHTLADVLRAEIDFSSLPPDTPAAIRDLLGRCLDRRLKHRLQWIGEARIAIEAALANPEPPPDPPRARAPLPWIAVAALALLIAAISGFLAWRSTRANPRPRLLFTEDIGSDVSLVDVTAGPTLRAAPNAIIAPDGSRIVFVNLGADGKTRLYSRRIDQPAATLIPGTEGALGPFFSPDSRSLGFFAGGKLQKISLDGGPPVELCPAENPMGGSWGDDGNIVLSLATNGPLFRISAAGGVPQPITRFERGDGSHRWPHVLPGSKVLLYSAGVGGSFLSATLVAQRLDTGERKALQTGATFPRHTASGHVLFVSAGTLMAARFDPGSLSLQTPVPLFGDLRYAPDSGGAQFDISNTGVLIYRSSGASASGWRLTWMDRQGATQPVLSTQGRYATPILSPNGTSVAFRIIETDRTSIWIHDIQRNVTRRLTFEPGMHSSPRWTPDGRYLVYSGPGGVFWTRTDGGSKPVKLLDQGQPMWFTPDGKRLAYAETALVVDSTPRQCMVVPLGGNMDRPQAGKPEPCLEADSTMLTGSDLSPDGRWLAYASLESGGAQVFVRAFPDRGGKWQVSTEGGAVPRWSAGGKLLFYINRDNRLIAVPIQVRGDSIVTGAPVPWSTKIGVASGLTINYSPTPDGKRVLLLYDDTAAQKPDAHLRVLLNFFDELKRRVH